MDAPLGLIPLKLGSLQVTPGIFMNLAMVLPIAWAFRDGAKIVAPKIIIYAWFPFLAWVTIEAMRSPAPVEAIKVLFNYLTYMCALYFGYKVSLTGRGIELTSKILVYSAIIPIVLTPLQMIVVPYAEHTRAASTFTHPNTFAFFLMISISYSFFALLYPRFEVGVGKRALKFVFFFGMLSLVLTQTRSAMLAVTLFIAITTALLRPKLLPFMLIFGLLLFALPPVHDRFFEVFTGSHEAVDVDTAAAIANGKMSGTLALDSYEWRKLIWSSAWQWIIRSPLMGYGLESFGPLSPQFFPLSNGFDAAHNIYVQLMFELGFIGLCLYLIIFGGLFVHISRIYKRYRPQAILLGGVVLEYLLCAYSDNLLYYLSVNWYFWFLIGAFLTPRRSLKRLPTKRRMLARMTMHPKLSFQSRGVD
ncbi:O-antigen ligase family protein [Rhizobium sp. L80/93]|uniref:O-antigen ligase family protein n=1 Tax=unclassified Rhizobium TaxID=2613769 RepID=UPI001AD97B17|nr:MULTISPECIES: O-antigen ligase family protein [unclassified Rhizobium]MBO9136785.1 O-antigen ligase family protein [Rhizobium sp. B209b/85]MBO9188053.1 O-antigen ligase family protein [Rhizobium sp. E27B/91]QXZ99067.1 O-antigen ligase family protein [Rhizobium sp. B230/85]